MVIPFISTPKADKSFTLSNLVFRVGIFFCTVKVQFYFHDFLVWLDFKRPERMRLSKMSSRGNGGMIYGILRSGKHSRWIFPSLDGSAKLYDFARMGRTFSFLLYRIHTTKRYAPIYEDTRALPLALSLTFSYPGETPAHTSQNFWWGLSTWGCYEFQRNSERCR